MRLTVVGTGVAGSALTRIARSRGHEVKTVNAQPPAASLAALAVLRVGYLSGIEDAREAVAFAVSEYEHAGCEVWAGAKVTSTRSEEERYDSDWWAVEPYGYLVEPDLVATVAPDWRDPESDWTIHATGSLGIEGRTTYGVTWFHADPKALRIEPGLHVHRFRPYNSVDAIRYSNGCRLGSSSAKSLAAARTAASRIMDEATQRGWIARTDGWLTLVGLRVQRDRSAELLAPGVWDFGGFHRVGWSLAPRRASQLIEELESREADA